MKKLLLALVLIASSATMAFAQAPAAAPRPGDEPRFDLVSKTNELEASLIRNRPEMTQAALPQIMAMMQMRINQNSQKATSIPKGDMQTKQMANVKAEQMLYSAFKRLSEDAVKNQKELIGTARKFIEIY